MVTCRPLVTLCLSVTLRSSYASLMAALMSTLSLSLFAIMYLFILSFIFIVPHSGTDFESAVCATGLVCLTRIFR